MPRDFFKDLALYTILMPLPEHIYTPLDEPMLTSSATFGGARRDMLSEGSIRQESVQVLESGVVGSLDYKIIVASNASGLFDWLQENHYSYGGDKTTLQFYIDKKSFFTVMKIDPKQMKHGANGTYLGEVTPTRFTFSSKECFYPLKITQLSVKDNTDALFYVQSQAQMDLPGAWSWMPSYRIMYLNFMLGCSADQQQQQELQERSDWLDDQVRKDPNFQTTKLEWARELKDAEMSVLENPLANYGQMGTGDLPPGAKAISLNDFLKEMGDASAKSHGDMREWSRLIAEWGDEYQPAKGTIVKVDSSTGPNFFQSNFTHYMWYPNREAPADDVKGLSRLKGHLQKGQWLTKFRKQIRKDEMTHDLVLCEVPKAEQQTYTRIMPTSPP
jgi:hypothetical protein